MLNSSVGSGMDRQLSLPPKSVIKFPLQSDSTWWPDVEVGAFECKDHPVLEFKLVKTFQRDPRTRTRSKHLEQQDS